MKILTLLLTALIISAFVGGSALAMCGTCDISKAQAAEKGVMANNKYCPISGEAIEKGHENDITYEYNGKIYSFCCPACLEPFKKEPGKYIKALEEKEKTGKDTSSAPSRHEHTGH